MVISYISTKSALIPVQETASGGSCIRRYLMSLFFVTQEQILYCPGDKNEVTCANFCHYKVIGAGVTIKLLVLLSL